MEPQSSLRNSLWSQCSKIGKGNKLRIYRFLSWGVPEFEMFYSFCFPVAFQLLGNGSGVVRMQRITIERTQRGGNRIFINILK
jgi:hypothetical protein